MKANLRRWAGSATGSSDARTFALAAGRHQREAPGRIAATKAGGRQDREPERMVVFAAHMRDHEVHLGHEKVTGAPMTEKDLERIIGTVYQELNDVQRSRVDFLYPDGSHWGRLQGWKATPLPAKEAARLRAQEERRRRRRQFFRFIFGRQYR
jgi:hypothetical protein